ncbi:Hydroxymethylglutaryl-CoA lyase, mitochondrial [Grifola frondosa]|uniref:hydroxymethylglutaryl-CoA lyase n=1 Tax=Grifola frondosa TaxID=5627 RepID=A0A1C7M575_GRIFR|nr:Hydroxymethylglutaryl-CoA lyase, mitochondrial [Grifola frondosa]
MFARCVTRSIASELTSLKPLFTLRSRNVPNEKTIIPPQIKAELVNRLSKAGIDIIESGSFVSPKWVPQMAGTAEVLSAMKRVPGHHYPVLVPNMKGLEALLALLSSQRRTDVPFTDEIAVFTAATDAFCKANTNCTVPESLNRLREVTKHALAHGLRVRGYVSVVIDCPYSGKVDPVKVKEVSRMLIEMGCYEVSLGDTVGTGSPTTVNEMLHTVIHGDGGVSPSKLAGHFHDTYGMGVANVLTALKHGLRTFDSAVGGLGGCPYSPGATGNVATEDVLYALRGSAYETSGNVEAVAEVGSWISHKLGRPNASRVGRALEARKDRERERYKEATQNVAAKL